MPRPSCCSRRARSRCKDQATRSRTIADSRSFVGGMPVALISDSSRGSSLQSSLAATSAPSPSRSSRVGSASAPGTGNDGPIARTITLQRVLPQHDQSADQDVVSGLDQAARGNVRQLRIYRLVQIVHFHHPDARPVVHPAHDGGIGRTVCRQGRHDGRFQIVARRYAGGDDLRFLSSGAPVVVGRMRPPEESRSSRTGLASAPAERQRWPDRAHDDLSSVACR